MDEDMILNEKQDFSEYSFSVIPEVKTAKDINGKGEKTNSNKGDSKMKENGTKKTETTETEDKMNETETTETEQTTKNEHHKRSKNELQAKRIAKREARAKQFAAMTEEEKEEDLNKLEKQVKTIKTNECKVGYIYKQIRDEKLYEFSKYNSSFSFYCRAVFNESRSSVYRQINYAEVLDIINESYRNYPEKVIRPLTHFKLKNEDKERDSDKDAPEVYDTEAILKIWSNVKKIAKRKTITSKIVEIEVSKYREEQAIGDDADSKIYIKCLAKSFDRATLADELIEQTTTVNTLRGAFTEIKAELSNSDVKRIQAECKKRIENWFDDKDKTAKKSKEDASKEDVA